MSDSDIKHFSAEALRAMRARGESRTNRARVDAMSEAELEAAIASDPAWDGIAADWHKDAVMVVPQAKTQVTLRLDADIIAFFRAPGRGYQTRMNAALRAFVRAQTGKRTP
jgi:uncharacterized protein (DUF4415 family)